MAYNVIYKKSVERDLRKIAKPEAARIIEKLETELSTDPEGYPGLTGSFAGLRKYRVGDYRVIYAVLDEDVVVLRIAHRRDAYR